MKLATLRSTSRDGTLVVVARDLSTAVSAAAIAPTLQAALDNWDETAPALRALSDALNQGEASGAMSFKPSDAMAPLPRAFQWLDASSFLAHGRILDKAFKIDPIPFADTIPIMYQGGSAPFLSATEDAPFVSEQDGIDFEAEFAIVTGDVPMGATEATAKDAVKLVMLINDWSLRGLQVFEMKRGFGLIHSKPATAFAPIAVTPDELGAAWHDERIALSVNVKRNREDFGHPSAAGMDYRYSQLIKHAARTRSLGAGTIIGFGTTSEGDPAKVGSACIAEKRGWETIHAGQPTMPFMSFGETVQIEVFDAAGTSVFGAIDQKVVQAKPVAD